MIERLQNIINKFIPNAKVVDYSVFGNGHINDTFKVTMNTNEVYLMQRINHYVFTDVKSMMDNIDKLTSHLKSKNKTTLSFIKTLSGESFLKTSEGQFWRMMDFKKNTNTYENTNSHDIAESTGRIIAEFQNNVKDLNVNDFYEIIPDFHDLEARLQQLSAAVNINKANRLNTVIDLIDYVNEVRDDLLLFYKETNIPLRITHNDTKLNNILFTNEDEPLCLVDLDTVMPGYIHYDFGDVVRTMCNTAEDDEIDLSKVTFNYDLYQSYKKGFLSIADSYLTTEEKAWLDKSGKLMTYIMAIRFLADYLNGDIYYKINYPMHNYDRAHCQFKYLKEMYRVF